MDAASMMESLGIALLYGIGFYGLFVAAYGIATRFDLLAWIGVPVMAVGFGSLLWIEQADISTTSPNRKSETEATACLPAWRQNVNVCREDTP